MRRKGLTLVELVIVFVIIALYRSFLMPAISKVRQIALRLVCGTSLSGIGKAMPVFYNMMKSKSFTLLILICIFFAASAKTFAKYSGGSGTVEDPYQIATAQDLIDLGNTTNDYDKHFIMTADIDMDPAATGLPAFTTAIIAPGGGAYFKGVFDGNDFKISNLTIDGGFQHNYLGLFGHIIEVAIIKNLGLENIEISGDGYIGGLVGCNAGSISNCYITGEVSGAYYVGSLAGYNNYGEITKCNSTCSVDGKDYVGGLVGYNDDYGEIIKCYSTCSVVGDDYVGGLLGYNSSYITNCYTAGSVDGEGNYVGGLSGYNNRAVSNCYSTCSVVGYDYVGGLVGRNSNSITKCFSIGSVAGNGHIGGLTGYNYGFISNCFSTSSVDGYDYVGGLVGESFGNRAGYSRIWNCYSTGKVIGNSEVGGLVGNNSLSNSSITSCFWDYETSGLSNSSGGGYGLPTDLMKIQAVYTSFDWDFDGDSNTPPVWVIREGITYPHLNFIEGHGTINEPYLISSPGELITIGYHNYYWDKNFKLINDIDLNGFQLQVIGRNNTDSFNGTFDGEGHVISDFKIISSGLNNVGLFGYVENALIYNLGLEDLYVEANDGDMVGSIVGELNNSTISNCYVTGSVTGGDRVGGLVGYNYRGSITSSYSTGLVSGLDGVGGLVGENHYGSITSSYSTGSVSGGVDYVGGLVGNSYPDNVRKCFWDMETSGQFESYGGTGKTTAQMQDINTFLNEGWDFTGENVNGTDDIWWIDNGLDYPRLWWELETE